MEYKDEYGVTHTTETYSQAQEKQYARFSDEDLLKFHDDMEKRHKKAQDNGECANEYYYGMLADESKKQLELRKTKETHKMVTKLTDVKIIEGNWNNGEYKYNVQFLFNGQYCGIGKFARTYDEALDVVMGQILNIREEAKCQDN